MADTIKTDDHYNSSQHIVNAVLAEVLLETERWLMVNSSIPVEKIIDLKEHLKKHFG